LSPVEIGTRVGVAPSTVHQVLRRCRINRLSHVDRTTGEPIRRYGHDHPGSLLPVDVKKPGNIPDGGGWRYSTLSRATRTGRESQTRNAAGTTLPNSGLHSCTPSSTTTAAWP